MANYHGYRQVAHSTYDEWRAATIGNRYDVDGYPKSQPYQCWDFCALLYFQYGRTLWTRPSGNGTAADCWNVSRQANSVSPFISVTGTTNIKRGDMLVFNSTTTSTTGHIGFADENYNGTGTIKLLSENWDGNTTVHVANKSLSNFLGIFRNTEWQKTPTPTPTGSTRKKGKFPWPIAWAHWDNFKN